ncbi:hypothetical protein ACFOWE_19470 [Planomonospora corallina]|uniref:Uncharacterized protein n=1 Tax=Planomonospora corallina TaxID=1806052 RepID=A0ABV8IBT8_9ACTN
MSPRNSVVPVVASGTATVVKLLAVTLAFAGLYVGADTLDGSSRARAQSAGQDRVRTLTLSADAAAAATEREPAQGEVSVDEQPPGGRCDRPYRVRSVITNADPESTVSYDWQLQRWSPASRSWLTYMTSGGGFGGEKRTVEWQPRIVDNPGVYRVKLSVSGGETLRSEKFMVSC